MLLRIELEAVNNWVDQGVVERWHVEEGGPVAFGDPLCDIAVSEIKSQHRRNHSVKSLVAGGLPVTRQRARKAAIRVRVVSADEGTVIAIRTPEGSTVRTGDLLAVARVGPAGADDGHPDAVDSALRFRVAADMVGLEGEEWDG